MAATDNTSRRGARGKVLSRTERLRSYRYHHRATLKTSVLKMLREPLQSLLMILVIAIALTLPAALYLGVENISQLSGGVDSSAQISVFVKKGARDPALTKLAEQLEGLSGVASVSYISAQSALDEFKAVSGFGSALQYLDNNPLPEAFLVQPLLFNDASRLVAEIRKMALVDDVQLDMAWLQRLDALLDIGRKLVLALAVALGLGVILVVGNTIRLAIQSRRDEITVVKLVGGTDAYVRRPFLYSGLLFGLMGALVAAILLASLGFWLAEPVRNLAGLYQSQYSISGLGFGGFMVLLLIGGSVGLIGAWLAVGQHLRKIKPN